MLLAGALWPAAEAFPANSAVAATITLAVSTKFERRFSIVVLQWGLFFSGFDDPAGLLFPTCQFVDSAKQLVQMNCRTICARLKLIETITHPCARKSA